jgi:Tol biopolymer transport system component
MKGMIQKPDLGGIVAIFVISSVLLVSSIAHAQSPQGRILFTSDRDGDYELFTMKPDGSEVIQLTFNTHKDTRARWSPDGTMIAFIRNDEAVWIMDSDGNNQEFVHNGSYVDFSPDGAQIVLSDYSGSFYGADALFIYDLETSQKTKLTDDAGSERVPAWHPNGEKIAYNHYFFFYSVYYKNIHVVNADGTEDADLTGCHDWSLCFADSPRWSPDGSKIAYQFVPGSSGEYRIHVMNADGSNKVKLTSGLGGEIGPVWSPDGRYIAFSGYSGHAISYIMNADGANVKVLLDDGHHSYPLDWRDDGTTVTLTAPRPNASESGAKGGFTVTRTGSTIDRLIVRYTVGGSAENGVDYRKLSGKVVIKAGASSANINVVPLDDTEIEETETAVLTLPESPSYKVGSPHTATAAIADNDATVTVTATRPNASESGTKGRFTVTRTGGKIEPLIVRYTVGGSAENGVDYRKLSGKVVIKAGASSANINVVPFDDTEIEGNEAVTVTLSSRPNYSVGSPDTGIVTIADND